MYTPAPDPLTAMLLLAALLSLVSQASAEEGDNTPLYLGIVLTVVTLTNVMVDFVQVSHMFNLHLCTCC